MLSREQAQAVAHLIHLLRPAWNAEGIYAALGRCRDRDAFDVALAALRAAHDPKAKNPGVIPTTGPHWNEEQPKPLPRIPQPPKSDTCYVCFLDKLGHDSRWAGDHGFVPLSQAARDRNPDGITHVRTALAAVRGSRAEEENL